MAEEGSVGPLDKGCLFVSKGCAIAIIGVCLAFFVGCMWIAFSGDSDSRPARPSPSERRNPTEAPMMRECREFQANVRSAQRAGASNEEIVAVLLAAGFTLNQIRSLAETCAVLIELE